jgi:hypothetical protein
MADKKNDARDKSGSPDNDAALQDELSREAAEGADSIGDVGSNRTLSGSSSWETLPDGAGGANPKSSNKPGQSPTTPSQKKDSR